MSYIEVLEVIITLVTLFVTAVIAYRAYRVYTVAKNTNLLLLCLGFVLISLYFVLLAVEAVVYRHYSPGTGSRFAIVYISGVVEVVAYLLIMLAYVVRPRMDYIAASLSAASLLFFTFQLFILILLLIVVISVWRSYRAGPGASTALVLSSFTILFLLHLVNELLLFSQRILGIGYLYYSVFQLLSFILLYMAIGIARTKTEERGKNPLA
jgi:hypothetical protein